MGRAAFVLVANCSPYTYAGGLGLDLVPGADFDEGLAYFAPVNLRARDLPRMALHGARGKGLKDGKALAAHDLDRIVVRCDRAAAAPGRWRGRGRRPRGRLRGRARRGHRPRLTYAASRMSRVLPAEGDLRRVIGDGENIADGEVDGLGSDELLAPVPQPRAPANVRRAVGRVSPPGADRHVRDLLEPRGAAGRSRVCARGSRLDLPGIPRVGDRALARDAGFDRAVVVARASGRLVEPDGLQRRVDLRADRDADTACGRGSRGARA